MIDKNKEKMQFEALEAWSNSGFKGVIVIPTGVGKTRILTLAVGLAVRKGLSESALISVPTEHIRDVEIPSNFEKWGYEEELHKCTIECIQSSYKRTGESWGILAGDEAHHFTSDEYIKVLTQNKFDKVLLLTATLSPEREAILAELGIPVVYRVSVKEALTKGVISKYKVFNYGIKLTESEQSTYDTLLKEFVKVEEVLGSQPFETAKLYKDKPFEVSFDEYKKFSENNTDIKMSFIEYKKQIRDIKLASTKYYRLVGQRKQLLYKAQNKAKACLEIFKKYSDRKGIYFSESIQSVKDVLKELQNASIDALEYHSKMNSEDRSLAMLSFKDGSTRVLCTAKAANEGVDIPMCSLGVCGSGPSTELQDTQRRGRVGRLDYTDPNKVSLYFNLYCVNTQEKKWVQYRIYKEQVQWIESLDEIEE